MRISYKTFPALKFFIKHDKTAISIDRPFWHIDQKKAVDYFHDVIKKYNGKISVVSTAFIEAAAIAKKSLGPLAMDILTDINQELYIEDIYIAGRQVSYINLIKKTGQKPIVNSLTLDKTGAITSFLVSDEQDLDTIYWYTSLGIENECKNHEAQTEKAYFFPMSCVIFHLFKHFSDIEIKEICRGKKEKVKGEKEIIYNELNQSIIHLNSTWFTEIVRTEGFAVRGHFRLQPKKVNGVWTKELIWIDSFLKHGYHRRAQKQIESM